ncbi:unnamed protein product [Anisakis simplex]|uniref:Uncharacterized protein n=1 Tax=Anisakis simplex TaxID=6269 RepID=A0A0M3KEJ2_ANISI|nr:unnamed protein product [Anisakis simplex]
MVNELDEDRLVVSYIRQKEHLERLKTNIAERISELFYFAISSLSKKVTYLLITHAFIHPSSLPLLFVRPIICIHLQSYKPVDLSMLTNASPSKKLKAMPKSENRSLIDPSKRKRTRPTGLQLPD